MNHGTATLKMDLVDESGNILRHIGEVGVITAFLPDDAKYAVMFDGKMGFGNWFTMDKVSFEMFFDYQLIT